MTCTAPAQCAGAIRLLLERLHRSRAVIEPTMPRIQAANTVDRANNAFSASTCACLAFLTPISRRMIRPRLNAMAVSEAFAHLRDPTETRLTCPSVITRVRDTAHCEDTAAHACGCPWCYGGFVGRRLVGRRLHDALIYLSAFRSARESVQDSAKADKINRLQSERTAVAMEPVSIS